MSQDETPVPRPNEADRDDDAIHYHDVDETDVSGTEPSGDDSDEPVQSDARSDQNRSDEDH